MDVKRLKEILSEMPDDAKVVYGLPDGGEEVDGVTRVRTRNGENVHLFSSPVLRFP